jgi:phosphoglycerol transferase MdoB-like AlkP superfamily enzyme
MEVRYFYPAETTVQVLLIMAATVLLMGLLFLDMEKIFRNKISLVVRRLLAEAVFYAAPVAAFFIMEQFTYNSIRDIYPVAVGLNLALYYSLYFAVYVLTNSRKATVILTLFASYFLGAANYFVLTFRGNPILPTDIASLTTAMNVAENYTYTLNSAFFTNALLFFFLCIGYCRISQEKKMSLKKRTALLAMVGVMVFAVTGVIRQETYLSKNNVKADIWNQKRGYSRDGAFASFCLNIKFLHAEKPEGYSVDKVMEIAETYIWNEQETASLQGMSSRKPVSSKQDGGNKKTSNKKAGKKPNIIMIMNEAFSDLEVINPIETNEDYMPFIHSLKENTIKGNLFVSIFGSGTCNSEFEVLTGNSMAFLPSGSIGYTQFVKDAMPNIAQTLGAHNYTGNIALHPYLADGWNRPTVYPLFGFEQFLSQDDFENPEMIRKYISDAENYNKIIDLYEENRAVETEDPFFLFTVTMQNHGGFSKDYGNMVNEIQITDEALKDAEAEQYLSLVKKSDDAFKDLVEYFENQDEPTMIVMWGDHMPSVHDEFYEKLYGKDLGDLTTEELQKKYQVPFLIWANYDIEEKEIDALSANYLSSYVLETADLDMTPYQRYLYDLSKKLPVINAVGYIGDDGVYYDHESESEYTDYIENYRILQYNNLIDYENRYTSFFTTETLVD